MKNVILVDYDVPNDWSFQKAIVDATNKKWEVIKLVSNLNHGGKIQELWRYLKYFGLAFNIFSQRKRYASVIAWQQFYGLLLAFYCKLFRVKYAPEIIIMTFIYKPKRSIWGVLYTKLMNYIVGSGYIKKFIVFSRSEQEYYSDLFQLPKSYFEIERLGIEDEKGKYSALISNELFYLSAGRSNRDYSFLHNTWTNEYRLEILCDTCVTKDTEWIKYYNNCHGEQYMQKLARCHAVVIPLEDEKISSGQLAILQAMMIGKPVIVTRNDTVKDYIENGIDGFIIDKNDQELKAVIDKLRDIDVYHTISRNARISFEEKFSLYAMGFRIGQRL